MEVIMVIKMRWAALKEKIKKFVAWCDEDGNVIYLLRWMLIRQGVWSTIDNANDPKPVKVVRNLTRFAIVNMVYATVIGLPMNAYSSLDQPLEVILVPLFFVCFGELSLSYSYCVIFGSDRLQEVITAYEAMKKQERDLPLKPEMILRKRNKLCKFFFYLITLSLIEMYLVLLTALPYVLSRRILYVSVWLPFDPNKFVILDILLVNSFTMMAVILTVSVLIGSFILFVLIQASSHLELLNHNLVMIRESALRRVSERFDSEGLGFPSEIEVNLEMEDILRTCILHHQAVNRLASAFEAAFSSVITHHFAACLIPASLAVISIQYAEKLSLPLLMELILAVGLAFDLLLEFYFANRITTESEMVRDSLFGCDWLQASDSFKRSMRIMMSKSNQPIVLTVGWGIPITLDTFQDLISFTHKLNKSVSALKIQ